MKKQLYHVIRGIQSDTLKERHKAGAVADLSQWPAEVIAEWVEQGVIAPVRGKKHEPAS